MAKRTGRNDGEATRQILLDTAERLFATEGVDAVSIRAINAAAGLAPAATHYHFGSKDILLEAVLLRRGRAVLDETRDRVEALFARDAAPTARDLIEALALPHVKLLLSEPVEGRYWNRVVAQLAMANDERLNRVSGDINERIFELVKRAFPKTDPQARAIRWFLASNVVVQMIGQYETLQHSPDRDAHAAANDYFDAIVDFVAEGLEGSMASARRRSGRARPSRARSA